ncbi:MAG: 3-oxoacyl-[acyl-carrier-protein] reductase [Rhodospirillaceae bacterium]|nr:3-oxoacyl-[acyl-carrier-protein] reductase [Alphaproteobacteria bacterium]MBR73125.1 3-oxoacyl-[acyl-carrier-protein] reductase [Rhodospirillaceae bacterium]|tara:strand:- start:8721 stop:9458 length:738 start_codon:yes stop_codon:yes gene_type:complete
MFNLSGKGALITGASGAIGAAIARSLHENGAIIGVSGTRQDKLAEFCDELGGQAHAIPCNLADHEAANTLLEQAQSILGGVDILVHCAGITRDNLMLRMKDDDWSNVINLNLNTGFSLARASLKGMMKNRWGRLIFITSVVGSTGNPGQSNYAASKAGLTGMAKALAAEVASRGVTVNCIAPGFIETPMTDVLTDEQVEKLRALIPTGRFGTPADVAAGCLYLASEESSYITGQTLHINGGMAMI